MVRASWNGVVVAESNETVVVEGNHYFPLDAVKQAYLREINTHTICGWKGQASYYDLVVDGQVNDDAAGIEPLWTVPIGGRMTTNLAVVRLAGGTLAVGAGREDGVLRVWQ